MSGDVEPDAAARALRLIGMFVQPASEFGTIKPVAAARVPEPSRSLLDHHSHMTVAMERHHGGPVALRVVARAAGPAGDYAREILLLDAKGCVVQQGIVRIDLDAVDATTAARIRAAVDPLGRVLQEAGVACEVGDVSLVEVVPGPHLEALIGPRPAFGRVASIAIGGRRAIDLLEIVAPG